MKKLEFYDQYSKLVSMTESHRGHIHTLTAVFRHQKFTLKEYSKIERSFN